MHLKNTVVIVTGASRGLGKELALQLSKEKCRLVLTGRNLPDLKRVKKEVKTECIIVKADMSQEDDVKKLFAETKRQFGKIDLLVNNAGMNYKKKFFDYSEKELDYLFRVNTLSVIQSCKEAYNNMDEGRIVIISSMAGLLSDKYYSVYSASKHALEGFVKGARKETEKPIDFLIFHPYRLATSFHKKYKHKSPGSHMLDPKDYARYIVSRIKGETDAFFMFLNNWAFWLKKFLPG
ncbi:MAG: SDR family oxidoreductase [Nanoarchaeota archaeon]|nr:SDR family oxidoreductase [Nanoarchaeota archaeon]